HGGSRVKLAKLERSGGAAWVAITDEGAIDLTAELNGGSNNDHLSRDGLARLADFAAAHSPDIGAAQVSYAPLLPDPEKIICVGVNYHNRNEEYRDVSEAPKCPSLFLRVSTSFTAHDAPLVLPHV